MKQSNILQELNLKKLFPVAVLGMVIGAIDLPIQLSFAVLIFSSNLAPFASQGIGMILMGTIIMQVVIAFISSMPGMVGGPQDSPSAIMALTAASIGAAMVSATPEARFATVVVTMVVTTIAMGVVFILVGSFKLGRYVRFIPYPVVGGFIAGTGLLLTLGALGVMTDASISFSSLGILFRTDMLFRWLPGTVFAVLLLLVTRRYKHFLITPAMIILAILSFYGYLWVAGIKFEQATTMGWLLGPFPPGALWKPLDFSIFNQARWDLIISQIPNLGVAAGISIIALLLNASALELIGKRDIDLNRELIAAGIANVAGGFTGSPAGYHYMGFSALPVRAGLGSRLIGVFSSLLFGIVLFFGATLLVFVPKYVVGGLILFLGLSFLVEWLYDAWASLPRADYVIVLIILAVIGWVGFLEGVVTGTAIAIILFVVNYSRIDIVKNILDGITYRSNVERPIEQRHALQQNGEKVYILCLQGFIFFGTAQTLLNRIRDRIRSVERTRLQYLILDFQNISALDSSAVRSFVRIKQMADADDFILVFTGLSPAVQEKLKREALDDDQKTLHLFPTLDEGMEWCENRIIAQESTASMISASTLQGQIEKIFPSPAMAGKFMSYLERKEVDSLHVLIDQGSASDAMYFVQSGQVATRLQVSSGRFVRLRSMGAGTVVGEIGLYLKSPRTATVIATEPTVLYRLSADSLKTMEENDPDLASRLHQWMVILLAERLSDGSRTLEVLLN